MRRLVLLLVALLPLAFLLQPRDSDVAVEPPPFELAGSPQPESFAGEAFRFYREKRLRFAGGTNPERAYDRARRHLTTLPRHALGRHALGRGAHRGTALDGDEAAQNLQSWEPLGPGNVGGRSRALVIHPTRVRTMYAAGVSGGVWKTTDAGRRWRPVSDAMANLSVNALAMSPEDPETLYAGTGEGYFREAVRRTGLPLRGAGIFKTMDGGLTWTRLSSTTGGPFRWVNDLLVSHNDPQRVYAATRSGVFRSLDGGTTWSRILATSVKGGCLDLDVRRDERSDFLFASCGTLAPATVYRHPAAEAGGPWERVLSAPGMGRTSIAVAPSRPRTVYALAASNEPGTFEQGLLAVYRSDQAGAEGSWSVQVNNTSPDKLTTLMLSNPIIGFIEECGFSGTNAVFNMGWYTNTLAVDPVDHEIVWVGGVDLFRSDDGGRTFGQASYWWIGSENRSYLHADQQRIVFHPRFDGRGNRKMYVLNDGGVYSTGNARGPVAFGRNGACATQPVVRWSNLNNGYGVTQFYHGSVFPDGRSYLAGAQDNGTVLGRDARGPDRWRRVFGGDGGYSVIDQELPSYVYATIQGGRVFRSTTGPEGQFVEETSGISDLLPDDLNDFRALSPNFLFISPLVGDPNNPGRLWLGGSKLWRSDRRAEVWTEASARLAGKVSAIAVAPGQPDVVLAGDNQGRIYRQTAATSAQRSTIWESTRPRRGFVSSIAFDPFDIDVVYATYVTFNGAHVWRSVDGGRRFDPLGTTGPQRLPNVPVHSLVVDPTDRQRLIVGTDLGVLVSTDGGDTWAVENTGFASVVTEWLTLAERGGRAYVYAFTHGRGAWRAALD